MDVDNVYIRRRVGKNHQPKYTIVIGSFVHQAHEAKHPQYLPFLRKSTLKHEFYSSPSQKHPRTYSYTIAAIVVNPLSSKRPHVSEKWHPPQKSLVSHQQHQPDQQAHNGGKTEEEGIKVDLVVLKKESIQLHSLTEGGVGVAGDTEKEDVIPKVEETLKGTVF